MPEQVDVAIIGAGPAGIAAAATTARPGLRVTVLDEQAQAGGQIYRGLANASAHTLRVLGDDYAAGQSVLPSLHQADIRHLRACTAWQVTPSREIYFSHAGAASIVQARAIVLANGAIERPMPFPGWTRAGVMTAGAAQILLKTSGLVPAGPVVLTGSGPLLYLLACQYLRAGADISALVETTPQQNRIAALRYLPGALRASEYLRKGLSMLREIRRAGVPHYRHASRLEALGDTQVASLRFMVGKQEQSVPCSHLLVHNGVVPNVQLSRSLELQHDWDALARCWRPRVGTHGESSVPGIYIAGDGAGIAGARAAYHQGRLAGLHVARTLQALSSDDFEQRARSDRRALARERAARPFIDALFAPAPELLAPADDTIVCRCEEVSAGAIRDYVRLGCLGPNQAKAFGRPGMGPCQGRMCGLSVVEVIAAARGVSPADVGYYRIRPPIKPVTLGELASLAPADS